MPLDTLTLRIVRASGVGSISRAFRLCASRSREPDAGLCARCAHARCVQSGKGSTFWLCGLSASEPRFPKYPRLPVVACSGFLETPTSPDPVRK
jgi:hypothetical protein